MKTVIQDLKGNRLYYEEITLYNKQHTFYIDHRRWLRGLPCNFPCTVIENMNEVFPKYFALESRLSDIHPRYQERVESEFKPRLKEIVAYHG